MRLWHFPSSVNAFFMRSHPVGLDVWVSRTLRLLPYFMCANSEGSGETARMRRLAWAFAARLCDKYHNLMSWLNLCLKHYPHFQILNGLGHSSVSGHYIQYRQFIIKFQSTLLHLLDALLHSKTTLFKFEPRHEKTCYAIGEQQRRRSACPSAQSDQRLCCLLPK